MYLLLAAASRATAAGPPCTSPLNPALETICYTTVSSSGNFSIRNFAVGLNVSLITSNVAIYSGAPWATESAAATEEMLLYFEGNNYAGKRVPTTVPLIFRPQASSLMASMAIPTSDYPSPAFAPRPEFNSVLEPFPAIRIAALTFETAALATDLEYSFSCGELMEALTLLGITPVAGPWSQAWVTFSGRAASPHINECWMAIPGKKEDGGA